MTIDFSQLTTYYIVLLPVIVSFVAGVLRQDRLPQLLNEGISYAVALILSAVQAILCGKLGGRPFSDFGIVATFTLAMNHVPLFPKFHQASHSKAANVGDGTQAP